MTDPQDKSITLRRVIEAPVESVFAAFTDPALLEQWQAEEVDFEAFEGGSLRFATADEDAPGTAHVVEGNVVSIEDNRKLVELWRMHSGTDITESTLVVTFEPLDDARTRVTLAEIAEAHADPQSRIFSIEAWDAALDTLAELIE